MPNLIRKYLASLSDVIYEARQYNDKVDRLLDKVDKLLRTLTDVIHEVKHHNNKMDRLSKRAYPVLLTAEGIEDSTGKLVCLGGVSWLERGEERTVFFGFPVRISNAELTVQGGFITHCRTGNRYVLLPSCGLKDASHKLIISWPVDPGESIRVKLHLPAESTIFL